MPDKLAILVPVFALAGWTGLVLILLGYRRVASSLGDARISPREYALGESAQVPLSATLVNRNYMNLLELPLLFYVGCLVAYATAVPSGGLLAAAWCYVLLRGLHTVIHVTYNRVLHRFAAFAASNVALIAFWVQLGRAVFAPTAG